MKLPMAPRLVPIDTQHPNRVAVMYGPVMMAQEARYQTPINGANYEAVLASLQRKADADRITLKWTAPTPPGRPVADLTPFYAFAERQPYRTYFNIDQPRLL